MILISYTDWDNTALPSIVAIETGEKTIYEGLDFALRDSDARDMHSAELCRLAHAIVKGDPKNYAWIRSAAKAVIKKIEADMPKPILKGRG